MRVYNCIAVFHESEQKALFCRRTKEPYQGLYNFVGGKAEGAESGLDAAYRELQEETGISRDDIQLVHLMDFTYYVHDYVLEIYAGRLNKNVNLQEELNPLEWLSLSEDFTDESRFAGNKNLAHIIRMAGKIPLGRTADTYRLDETVTCIGADGCKGGWIAAVISGGRLQVEKYGTIEELVQAHPASDQILIDMVIGLPGTKQQIRPDAEARKILKKRSSTVFPSPCRQAVYAQSKQKQTEENQKVLGAGLSSQAIAIFPKIRELDEFLQHHAEFRNVIKESHLEVCFAKLNGAVVMTKKQRCAGMLERVKILRRYLPQADVRFITEQAEKYRCMEDDIVDAVCLAVTANLYSQGKGEPIPQKPMQDDTGLLMQMIVPKIERVQTNEWNCRTDAGF